MTWKLFPLGGRTLSLALIFNSLVCFFFVTGLINGIYTANWKVYQPYLLSGGFFWAIIIGSLLTILLALNISQKTYSSRSPYGMIFGATIFAVSLISLSIFTPLSITGIFTSNTTDIAINMGRFFLLSGIAMILVQFPTQLKKHGFNIKSEFFAENSFARKALYWLQLGIGVISMYIFIAVVLYMTTYQKTDIAANYILSCVVLIIGITSFAATAQKSWLN